MNFFLTETNQVMVVLAMVVPRFLTIMAVFPVFAKGFLPGMLRNSFAVSLCLILVPPLVLSVDAGQVETSNLPLIIFKEVMVGFLLAFPLVIPFWAAEAIGAYIDNQRGAAMASSMDPLTGSETTPMGMLFTRAFATFFLASGSFLLLLDFIYSSYSVWPVTEFFPTFSADMASVYLSMLDRLMWLTIVLSAPIIIAMFLSELALALVSRFAPQLNVFFLAMPVKSAMGVFILILYFPLLLTFLSDELHHLGDLMGNMGAVFK